MFNKEFYPTPLSVAHKMANGYNDAKYVLDPSAGKGDLLQPFLNRYTRCYGIEHNLELCGILRDKKVSILGYDFFKYDGADRFDLVIMNPPFSNGIDHLLHAWETCAGADIVCLLPSEVHLSPNTEKSRLLENIINEFGEIEELGEVFGVEAERSAKVSVSIIRLKRKESEKLNVLNFIPEKEKGNDSIFDEQSAGLVKRDRVKQIVGQYNGAMEGFEMMFAGISKIRASAGLLLSDYRLDDVVVAATKKDDYRDARDDFNVLLKKECWDAIFTDGKFQQMVSSAVRRDFDKFLKDNESMSFSEENIKMVFGSLFESREDIVKQAIQDAFDYLTKFYKDNREHIEGWKTNDRWKVRRKFILPNVLNYEPRWGGSWQTYRMSNIMRDVEIALCYLTSKNIEDIKTVDKAIYEEARCRPAPPKIYAESEFFEIVCHKKGTGHFVFKEEDLWNRFNRKACGDRMWLHE